MSILDRFRGGARPPDDSGRESLQLNGTVPGPDGRSFVRVSLEMDREAVADGEETQLRMHLSADFSALTGLPAPAPDHSDERALAPTRRWVGRQLASARMQRVLAPLADKTYSTWVQLRTTTTPLDGGSRALVPTVIDRLGLSLPDDGVPLHAWTQDIGEASAQMAILNVDAEQLPPWLRRLVGPRFKLGGTIVNLVEPNR